MRHVLSKIGRALTSKAAGVFYTLPALIAMIYLCWVDSVVLAGAITVLFIALTVYGIFLLIREKL
jgi:hypothetical protein